MLLIIMSAQNFIAKNGRECLNILQIIFYYFTWGYENIFPDSNLFTLKYFTVP